MKLKVGDLVKQNCKNFDIECWEELPDETAYGVVIDASNEFRCYVYWLNNICKPRCGGREVSLACPIEIDTLEKVG